ncbi:MAG: hypothetical protein WCW17_02425 [Patescibacteria group bacterium]
MNKLIKKLGWLFIGFGIGLIINPKDNLITVLAILIMIAGFVFAFFMSDRKKTAPKEENYEENNKQ